MKGETHFSLLVLESFGRPCCRFDLTLAMPVLAGLSARDPKMTDHLPALFRSLYVGTSHADQLSVHRDRRVAAVRRMHEGPCRQGLARRKP